MRFTWSGALCALTTTANVFASFIGYGTCGIPLSLDGFGECQDQGVFDWDHYQNSDVVVTPLQNPHVDRLDYAHLASSRDASLFYSQAAQPGSQAQFAAVLNFTMSYPTIITEDSAYISSCSCAASTGKGTTSITLTFTDDFAFSYTRNWPSNGLVLVINTPNCSRQSDERGVYLVSEIILNAPARTIRCQGKLKAWEDVSETLEIGFGRIESSTGKGSDKQSAPAATRAATRYWTSDGALTSSTYITTALPIHFSTSITATSLQSTSYRRPSSRPGSIYHGGSLRKTSLSSLSSTSASSYRASSSMTDRQSKSISSVPDATRSNDQAWSPRASTTTTFSSELNTISTLWTPTTRFGKTSSTSTDHSSQPQGTSGSSTSTRGSTTSSVTTSSTLATSVSNTSSPSSSESGSSSTTSSASFTVTISDSSTSTGLTSSSLITIASSTSSLSSSENETTSTTTTPLSSGVTVSTSESSSFHATANSTTASSTSESSAFANTTTTYPNSATTTISRTILSTTASTTRSYHITPPSLSPEAQEIWDAIMDVLDFDEDGAFILPISDEVLARSNGELPTTFFDPFDADQQAPLLDLNAQYGFDSPNQIVSDVRGSLQEAASKEYAITLDMNIDDPAPEKYVATDMVDRSSVVGIDDPDNVSAEDQKEYLRKATQDLEDMLSGLPRGDDDSSSDTDPETDGGDAGGSATGTDTDGDQDNSIGGDPDIDVETQEEGPNVERRSAGSRHEVNFLRSRFALLAKRQVLEEEDDDDGLDPAEIAWEMAGMLGEMGCAPCNAAKQFKDAWDQAAAFIGIIDFLIKSSKIRVEASTESWVDITVPPQVLDDDWLRRNMLSVDDASFSVSSLIVETKILVDIPAKKLLAGEITTSVTSKSNLQLKFESSGTMNGLWEFVVASMDLQSVSAPGIFKISPRFLYSFGVHYEIAATGTTTAGANIAVDNAQVSVDVGNKVVTAAKNWKPSKIDLKYPGVNPWEWAMIAPFTKTTIVLNLELFGQRYDNAVVVTTQTKIGYEEGRVYLTESRQCQARNMKQVSTLDTTTKVTVLGQTAETLYKASYPLNSRCWQPAGEPALCPEGIYDNDYYELGGYGWRVRCGEAVTQDTAFYDGRHLLGSSAGLDYERFPSLNACANECATTFYEMNEYKTGNPYGGCQLAVWLPESGFNCVWVDWNGNKRVEGYGIAVAERTELVDGCEYMKQSGLLVGWDKPCPDVDIDALIAAAQA